MNPSKITEIKKQKEYFWGIDFLRIIAIFNVVVLHTLGRSGVLSSSIVSQYNTAWLVRTFAYSAVDIFGIVSGFVNYSDYKKSLKISRLAELWLQAFFYGLLALAIVILFTDCAVQRNDVITTLLPLIKGEYWFFSAYVGMMVLSGPINSTVRNADNRTLYMLTAMIFSFTVIELIAVKTGTANLIFNLNKGYSCIWLAFMYFIGAVMRKTEAHKKIGKNTAFCLGTIIGTNLFSWIWMAFIYRSLSSVFTNGNGWDRLFEEYISPTIVIAAVLTVALFANIHMERKKAAQKIIKFAAPTAFNIYLLNSQPLIAKYIYNADNLSFLYNYNYLGLAVMTIAVSAVFFAVAVMIDKLRDALFKIIGIKKLINIIGNNAIDRHMI